RSRRGPQMSATRDSTLHDPKAIIIDLQRQLADVQRSLAERTAEQDATQRQLAECRAERDEALQRETATAEILEVINSSPGNLKPVFDAILDKAHSLCEADHGNLALFDGDSFRAVAVSSASDAFAERLRKGMRAIGSPIGQPLLDGARFVHIRDMADHPAMRA